MLEIVPIPPSDNELVDAGIRGMTVEQYRAYVEPPVRSLAEIWRAIKDRYYDWQWRSWR